MASIVHKRPFVMGRRAVVYLWETLTTTDGDGSALDAAALSDKTVQVFGTFDAGTITIEGSNDGENWETLTDPQGNALSFTSKGIEVVLENPAFMRPFLTGGTGNTDLDVYLCAKGDT